MALTTRHETTCQLQGCPKLRFRDQDVVRNFCCHGHAQLASARGEWPPPASRGSSKCSLPGCEDFVYRDPDTSEESKYCSMKHVNMAKSRECVRCECPRTAFLANTAGLQCCSRSCENNGDTITTIAPSQHFTEAYCIFPGCRKEAMRFATWRSLHFCSETHRALYARLARGFRSPCDEPYTTKVMAADNPILKLCFLDEGHPEHQSLADQFASKWAPRSPGAKSKKGLEVLDVIKIQVPHDVRQRHEDYKAMVPNVRRRFHGTSSSSSCLFYVGGPMCLLPDCALCNICMFGFKMGDNVGKSPARGSRSEWLMFGKGLYFTSASRKADFFSERTEKAFVTTDKFPELTRPPMECDSVVGEAGPNFKDDILVVYNRAAALPTHFVVYRR